MEKNRLMEKQIMFNGGCRRRTSRCALVIPPFFTIQNENWKFPIYYSFRLSFLPLIASKEHFLPFSSRIGSHYKSMNWSKDSPSSGDCYGSRWLENLCWLRSGNSRFDDNYFPGSRIKTTRETSRNYNLRINLCGARSQKQIPALSRRIRAAVVNPFAHN